MDQHLHPVASLVGKQVGAMGSGRTEDLNDSCQSFIRSRPHVQRFGGQPDLINADHPNRSRNKAAHWWACSAGHSTTTAPLARGISMRMVLRLSETEWWLRAEVAAGRLTGTNSGVVAGALGTRRASLIQRRTMLALRPLHRAIRETDAPGSRHWATIPALNSRENRRRRWQGLVTLNSFMLSVH